MHGLGNSVTLTAGARALSDESAEVNGGPRTMFWTELFIAPAVVLVIFFLFTLTNISGIAPSETSLTGNIGFAFVFGFAIRRTLGLLDTIKKRLSPEPSP